MKTTRVAGTLLSGIILFTAGCSLTPKHSITKAQAVQRIDSYLQETINAVPSQLHFSRGKSTLPDETACIKWYSDSDSTGQIMPNLAYTASTSGMKDSEAIEYINNATTYWKDRSSSVENRGDGFAIDLHHGYGLLFSYYKESHIIELLGVLERCIWRHGTPQPATDP